MELYGSTFEKLECSCILVYAVLHTCISRASNAFGYSMLLSDLFSQNIQVSINYLYIGDGLFQYNVSDVVMYLP